MLYRFHFDISGFSFDDWNSMRSSIFKDDCEFKIVVYEIAKATKKPHYQGVLVTDVPASTFQSRIKRHKNEGAKRGCYSFKKQDPKAVDGYYNYLCKGDSYGVMPDVLQSTITPEDIKVRHERYHTGQRDVTDLEDAMDKLVLAYDAKYDAACKRHDRENIKHEPDTEGYPRQMWVRMNSICLYHLMNTSEKGFIPSQVQRLAFKMLSMLINKAKPGDFVTEIPPLIADRLACSSI